MPTTRDNIEKWSLSYYMLKHLVDLGFHFYFRTTVTGFKNLPKGKTLIFAPNHQNALMDALAILCLKAWQPVYLARADIFKKPTIRKILTYLKMLPIYRIRDGYDSLQQNDEIFNKTIDVLRNKNGLVILPEGNHGDKKRLRPLKKGVARIALQAYEADSSLDIVIVPVGLDYTNYIKVRSKLLIRFGEPFSIKPFMCIYKDNPAKAYNMLIARLEKGIKAEMIDIQEEKYYSVYKVLIEGFAEELLKKRGIPYSHANIVDTQQLIIRAINKYREHNDDDFLLLAADALEYRLLLERRKIPAGYLPLTSVQKAGVVPFGVLLLATIPLFIASFVNIFIPVAVSNWVSKKFDDKQFISSVRYVVGLVLALLMFIIQVTLFAVFAKNLLYSVLYALGYGVSFLVFFEWKKWANILANRLNVIKHLLNGKSKRLVELHESLCKQLEKLVEE